MYRRGRANFEDNNPVEGYEFNDYRRAVLRFIKELFDFTSF